MLDTGATAAILRRFKDFLAKDAKPLFDQQKSLIDEAVKSGSCTSDVWSEMAVGLNCDEASSSYCLAISLSELSHFARQQGLELLADQFGSLNSRCISFYREFPESWR